MQNVANGRELQDQAAFNDLGHKFGIPELPLPSTHNLKHRYDPVVSQVTNLLMRHGKKGVAQRVGSSVSLWFPFALHILLCSSTFRSNIQ
jgi:hypothetical protein